MATGWTDFADGNVVTEAKLDGNFNRYLGPLGFGDGSDGAATISGNTSLNSDVKYYTNLTVNNGIVLDVDNAVIYCTGTLTLTGTANILVNPRSSGSSGGKGTGSLIIYANAIAGSGTITASGGDASGNTGTTAATNGSCFGVVSVAGASNSGSAGGAGGVWGLSTTITNGAEDVIKQSPHLLMQGWNNWLATDGGAGGASGDGVYAGGGGGGANLFNGGAGGAASGGAGAERGGHGGGAGGFVFIFTPDNNSTIAITAVGGAGSDSQNAGAGSAGGGGGGAGGLVCTIADSAFSAATVTGGAGGTGRGGGNGTAGEVGYHLNLSTA